MSVFNWHKPIETKMTTTTTTTTYSIPNTLEDEMLQWEYKPLPTSNTLQKIVTFPTNQQKIGKSYVMPNQYYQQWQDYTYDENIDFNRWSQQYAQPTPTTWILTPARVFRWLQLAERGLLGVRVHRNSDVATILLWEMPKPPEPTPPAPPEDESKMTDVEKQLATLKRMLGVMDMQKLQYYGYHVNGNYQKPTPQDSFMVHRDDVADPYIWETQNDLEFVVAIFKDLELQWKHL